MQHPQLHLWTLTRVFIIAPSHSLFSSIKGMHAIIEYLQNRSRNAENKNHSESHYSKICPVGSLVYFLPVWCIFSQSVSWLGFITSSWLKSNDEFKLGGCKKLIGKRAYWYFYLFSFSLGEGEQVSRIFSSVKLYSMPEMQGVCVRGFNHLGQWKWIGLGNPLGFHKHWAAVCPSYLLNQWMMSEEGADCEHSLSAGGRGVRTFVGSSPPSFW